MDSRSALPPFISKWIEPRKVQIEIVLTSLSLLSLLIYSLKINGGAEMVMISLSIHAGFYFISAYIPSDFSSGIFSIIAHKVISIASSVSVISFLFSILKLTGAMEMMLIGFTAMVGASLTLFFSTINQWNQKLTPLFIRVVVLVTLTGLVQLKLISF